MKKFLAGLLVVTMAALFGCGGGGGSDSPQTTSLSGVVTFPASLAKAAALEAAPTMEVRDLSGALITTVTLTPSAGGYSYSGVTVALGKDYVLKAVKGTLVLRALVNKAALTDTTGQNVNNNTTTAIIVVEKALPSGTLLGETAITADAQTAFALTPPAAEIVQNIVAALTACTSVTSTPVTAAQAELASLANIVTAAVISGIDPRAFVAGTWVATTAAPATTVTATTYTVSGAGTVTTSSNDTVTTSEASAIAIVMPQVSSAGSTTFTVGTAGTFNVTGNGALSITGALPSGVTFDAATGVLSGTPATSGTYPLTFTVTKDGFTATQAFTLTVNPAAVTPTPVTPTTNAMKTVLLSGLYDTHSRSYQSGGTSVEAYSVSRVGLSTSGTSLTETQTSYYDRASKTWTSTLPAGVPADLFGESDYLLTASGWVYVADGPGNYSPVFNTDGTATLTGKVGGRIMKLAAASIDISGHNITNAEWPLAAGAGTFPAGSVGYQLTFTGLTDSYSLWASNSLPSTVTSLTQVPALGWNAYIESSSDLYYYNARFISGGNTVDIYQQSHNGGDSVKIGTGSYAITTVSGQQVLEVAVPAALRTQYKLGSNPIYGIVNGVVYGGAHEVAGESISEGGGFNLVAAQHLQNSIDKALAKGALAKGLSKSILGW